MRNSMKTMSTVLILIIAAAGAGWASQPVNETIPVAPGSEISVENLAGSLTFEGWDSATLEVTGTLGDGVERLDIDVDEDGGGDRDARRRRRAARHRCRRGR